MRIFLSQNRNPLFITCVRCIHTVIPTLLRNLPCMSTITHRGEGREGNDPSLPCELRNNPFFTNTPEVDTWHANEQLRKQFTKLLKPRRMILTVTSTKATVGTIPNHAKAKGNNWDVVFTTKGSICNDVKAEGNNPVTDLLLTTKGTIHNAT